MVGCHCPGTFGNSSSAPEQHEHTSEAWEAAKAPGGSSGAQEGRLRRSLPSPRKRNLFPRSSWLVVILKRTVKHCKSSQKEELFSPKENQTVTLKSQETRVIPRKRGHSSQREATQQWAWRGCYSESCGCKKSNSSWEPSQENQSRRFLAAIRQRWFPTHPTAQ